MRGTERDERAIAKTFETALRQGEVVGLDAMPAQVVSHDDDPPDAIVQVDDRRIAGVEFTSVVDPEYVRQYRAAQRGQLDSGVWSPAVAELIVARVEGKVRQYGGRAPDGTDWLLVHDSLADAPGSYDLGMIGHRSIREILEGRDAARAFDRVLLQTTWQQQTVWSVVAAHDGTAINTRADWLTQRWRERVRDDGRVATEGVRVYDDPNDVPPRGRGVVLRLDCEGALEQAAVTRLQPAVVAYHLFAEAGGYFAAFIPTQSNDDADALCCELQE